MPTLIILATADDSLADAWERQLLPGRIALRLAAQDSHLGASSAFAAVVVLDAAFERMLPSSVSRCPAIYVGEPRSMPFEQAKMAGRAKAYLSYQDSMVRLREILPLLEELSEKQSMIDMLREKTAQADQQYKAPRVRQMELNEFWDFLECAVECIDDRERLVVEFRRAARHLLRASHAVFFLRRADGYRADRGTSFFSLDDPLVGWFESNPVIVDGVTWARTVDPIAELAVRNRLALWGARMLVPIHDNGRLLGLVALGVRDDGESYDDGDRARAIFLARLLRHFLIKSAQFSVLEVSAEKLVLGSRYLPGTVVLGPDESAPRHLPLVVRDLIGRVRNTKDLCRAVPSIGQPFRAYSGIIIENGGVWAWWHEASQDVYDLERAERAKRSRIFRDLSLTLSHELSNSLVSLGAFRQSVGERNIPLSLIDSVKGDISRLEALNDDFTVMQGLHEAEAALVDIRDVVQKVGLEVGVTVEVGAEPIVLSVCEALIEYAFRALLRAIVHNGSGKRLESYTLKVRNTGEGQRLMALVSIRGINLELEGVIPEPSSTSVPDQGRMDIFLAKEILSMHDGGVHAGPGMEGTEIYFSVRGLC